MKFFFQKNDKNNDELFRAIEHACDGLIYISETDAPMTPFAGQQVDAVTVENILQQAGLPSDAVIEEKSFDEFFARLTTIKDWYGEKETERAKRFLELKMLLEENLHDLKVFRIGTIRLDIFAVGINKDGALMGVSTKAVET